MQEFRIVLADHSECTLQYIANVDAVLAQRNAAGASGLVSPLHMLGMSGGDASVASSAAMTTRRNGPIYVEREELGNGEFGRVHTVLQASTGAVYAAKRFTRPGWDREVELMRRVTHVSVHDSFWGFALTIAG